MQVEDGYPATIREVVRTIKEDNGKAKALYTSPEALAEFMRPDSAHNHDVLDLLDSPTAAYLRITPAHLVSALRAKRKRLEKERKDAEKLAKAARKEAEKQAEQERKEAEREAKAKAQADAATAKTAAQQQRRQDTRDAMQATIGGVACNEREFVHLFMLHNGISMSFDRQYHNARGETMKGEKVLLDVHLTSADLNLNKPRGDLLSVSHLDRAFTEWCLGQRDGAIERVMQRIFTLPPDAGVTAEGVILAFERICGMYFKDPVFAARAIQKAIWQIKRMLLDMPVEQRHMFIFLGAQNCGKSFVQRMIMAVINELVAEASLKDVLDERQMDLPTYAAILLDELVSADRADSAALKNFVTGTDWARRPMRTNVVEKVKLRATLFGTSNYSLGKLIYDSTGMRRYVELMVLTRTEIEPNWAEIVGFNYLQLWQAVDVEAEDPLMAEFAADLTSRQEELRNPENTESWIRQFEPERGHNVREWTANHVSYYAADLYVEFRRWEEEYDPGWRGTSLSRWGRDMKSLIEQGHVLNWSVDKVNNKTVYVVELPEEYERPNGGVQNLRDRIGRGYRNPYNSL